MAGGYSYYIHRPRDGLCYTPKRNDDGNTGGGKVGGGDV